MGFASTKIWYDTERERERERASTVDPIDYAIVVCSQQLLVLHWMNNSMILKIYIKQ